MVLSPPCVLTPPLHRRGWFGPQIRAAEVKLSAAQFCSGNAQLVAATTTNLQLHWNCFSVRWPNCETASSGQVVFVWTTWSSALVPSPVFFPSFSSSSYCSHWASSLNDNIWNQLEDNNNKADVTFGRFFSLWCYPAMWKCTASRLKNTFWHAALRIPLVYFSRSASQELWSLVSENHCCVYFTNPFPSSKMVCYNELSLSQHTLSIKHGHKIPVRSITCGWRGAGSGFLRHTSSVMQVGQKRLKKACSCSHPAWLRVSIHSFHHTFSYLF